ncbi:SDR family oxidoreductase [Conexibacter woesei]|uniref:Short-chain dehydrogenase/reductase SDR n=1 Tax=Conexibacter woesei (strain DSM 14684 / CCUG 47730 / CIP 108061 / JCM 11494 / NBRC 100937 / ID131577) TaxID=469383 RepID=D3F3R3_CONWI|nr:SDR family NAD(P)-dependent oxidoreductase [Conexibacter woesei]ADB52428.1 short-chain dehydrogenase/reductase SDR [Conexibacter woesei DSM 14684]
MGSISYDFAGRTAIVTGAGRGIGLALARRFADAGADVFAVDVDEAALEDARAVGAVPVVADVARTDAVADAVELAVRRTGRVDVLVNNAGILRDRMLWKLTDEEWDAVLAVHLGATFRFTRACVPHFRAGGGGRVINVTSYTGLHGNVGQSAYAAAKAGIIGFTKTAAKELAAFGVTVNAISPNAETRMIESMPDEARRGIEALIPLRRFAQPAEITAAVAFLASDDAGYVTGTVLPVDGGLSM